MKNKNIRYSAPVDHLRGHCYTHPMDMNPETPPWPTDIENKIATALNARHARCDTSCHLRDIRGDEITAILAERIAQELESEK